MNRKAFKTTTATLAVGLGLLGALPAAAQTPPGQTPASTTTVTFPGDWPNLGAFSNRQGRNGNPAVYTSGATVLRYLTPNTPQDRSPIVLDNTDLQAYEFSTHTSTTTVYDDPLNSAFDGAGRVLSYATYSGPTDYTAFNAEWPAPTDATAAAGTTNFAADVLPSPPTRIRNITAAFPYNAAPRSPQYQYATCVPSARDSADPRVPQSGTAKVFTWSFAPLPGGQRTYALFANLPVGPTTIPADPSAPTGTQVARYTQQYYVYEILWGPDKDNDGVPDNRLVDVRRVDGASRVRLGISGNEDSTVFPSDGTRIIVRLYNTVPRDNQLPDAPQGATNRLTLSGATTGDTDTKEAAESLTHLVYADETTARPETGTFAASPVAATLSGNGVPTVPTFLEDLTADWDVTVARNNLVTGFSGGNYFTSNQGVVINYQANPQRWLAPSSPTSTFPYEKWRYSVLDTTSATTTIDSESADASPTPQFTASTANPFYNGTNYLVSDVAPVFGNVTAPTGTVTYSPTLGDGDYDVYVYIPGNGGGEAYGHNVLYQIQEGPVANTTNVYVDQTIARGWLRIGTRRFINSDTNNLPLKVIVTNQSTFSAPGITPVVAEAAGTKVYADAIRFVGSTNSGISSTPVHATLAITPQGGGTPVPTKVVIVADESGKIHCLDEVGRGDGTTTEYWSYPSTPDLTDDNWIDPNLFASTGSSDHDPAAGDLTTPTVPGPDGAYNKRKLPYRDNTPTAVMPSGFDLSTATIAHVPDPLAPNDITSGRDLLYIGATNGRVYCIDCSGRGDYNFTNGNRKVGTARRQWSFPSDYPSAQQASGLLAFRGSLVFGDANQGCDGPTVFVPARQGRIVALDAFGTPATDGTLSGNAAVVGTGGVTATKWQYPEAQSAPLPFIEMTPTLILPTPPATGTNPGRLLFGTRVDANSDTSGEFYCLDATSGNVIWDINGEAYNAGVSDDHILSTTIRQTDASLSTLTINDSGTGLPVTFVDSFSDFTVGPVAVTAAVLGQVAPSTSTTTPVTPNFSTDQTPTTPVDTVYLLNDNGIFYGLQLSNGALVTGHDGIHTLRTATSTLSAGNLAFTVVRDQGRNGPLEYFPQVLIPDTNHGITAVFARVDDYSLNDVATNTTYLSNYVGSGTTLHSDTNNPLGVEINTAGLAAADNYLFATDAEGGFYAFGEDASGLYANVPTFDTGVDRDVSANNPLARAFKHLHVKLVNRAGYIALKKVNTDGTGGLTYAQLASGVYDKPRPTGNNPYAFEWGETAYVAVYGFPYATYDLSKNRIAPPTINITLTTDTGAARTFPVDSRQLASPTTAPKIEDTDPVSGGDLLDPNGVSYLQDGYAITPIAFSNAGSTALPPGNGTISASLSTGALSNSGGTQVVYPDLRTGYGNPPVNDATIRFILANPLAIVLADPTTGKPSSDLSYQIGFSATGTENSTNTALEENRVNGTPNLADPTAVNGSIRSQLQTSTGLGNHGSTSTTRVYVVDRSLMVLLQEDGIGNVRMLRSNLQRQGGLGAIVNPLDATLYPGFEDKPTNFPNTSLDYPNIGREQIRASATAGGMTGNPILTNVRLATPRTLDNTQPLTTTTNTDANNGRTLVGTPVDLSVDLPLYQPPVDVGQMKDVGTLDNPSDLTNKRHNSKGIVLDQGYFGRVQVFVDTTNNGQLNTSAPSGTTGVTTAGRKPYRSFNLSAGVNAQYSILTNSPTVDLGSVASGTGFQPGNNNFGNPQRNDASGNGRFDPWSGDWGSLYQPISVRNDGNVNLRHLRVAKGTFETGGSVQPWALTAADTDPLAYMTAVLSSGGNVLNGTGSLWSNIDATFAATNPHDSANPKEDNVILPKPRVTDRVPTELVADPFPRANPNLVVNNKVVNGSKTFALNTNAPFVPTTPKVGVAVPLGFPVGNYATQIRIVEDGSLPPDPTTGLVPGDLLEILQYNKGVYEAYSDPITLTYKVRESRLTNRETPRTAPMIDNAALFPDVLYGQGVGDDAYSDRANGTRKASYVNTSPAAMRAADGSLVVAWDSDRANLGTGRIFMASAKNDATFGASGTNAPGGNSPLWDLTQFDTTATSWFRSNGTAYPNATQVTNAFPEGSLANTANTVRFGSPAFSSRGQASTFDFTSGGTTTVYMGFVGDAQVATNTGRLTESKVFLSTVTLGNAGPTADAPIPTASDPQTAKGKPAVLNFTDTGGAMLFYSETSAGQSGITADRLAESGKSFAPPVSLDFGGGFSSVFSPSVTARRMYVRDKGPRIIEMSFAGKLRGRSNAEAYLGRLQLGVPQATDANDSAYGSFVANDDPNAVHLLDAQKRTAEYAKAGTPFMLLPVQQSERLLGEGAGTMRARGVAWNRTDFLKRIQDTANFATSPLVEYLNGDKSPTDLLVRSTVQVDRQSGLIVCDSRLGGKAYIDPELGTVRFVGATPGINAEVRLTYQPTFLRVTPGGTAAYSSVNGLFDDRFAQAYDANGKVVAPAYWFSGSGAYGIANDKNTGTGNVTTAQVRNDRYYFAYSRGAAGGGVTARPYTTTMRLGLRLPTRIATDDSGNVLSIQVTRTDGTAMRPYQVDPANGRIYVQAEDEDQNIQVTYTGVNEAKNSPVAGIQVFGTPSFVLERGEEPVPVDQATNDSALTAFLDPFTFSSQARPPLVWMFYVSTRAGQPDLYFQTVAPPFTPTSK